MPRVVAIVSACLSCVSCVRGDADDSAGSPDAGDWRATPDAAPRRDATSPPADAIADTPVDGPRRDAGRDTAGCKTECGGTECGKIPDGCGGTLSCIDCSMPGEICVRIDPLFQGAVRNAAERVKASKPPYLDPSDAKGDSIRVRSTPEFRAAVIAELKKKPDIVVIPDPNDGREIRVRGAASGSAENYLLVTSAGYSAYKYTSTCTPAGF